MSGIIGSVGSKSGVIGLKINPSQPWVKAVGDGGTSTLPSSYTKITAWSEVKDTGSNFASGVFTAPITGAYLITGRFYAYGLTADDMVYGKIVSSNRTYYCRSFQSAEYGSGPAIELVICEIMDMDASDTVEFGMYNNQGARGTLYEHAEFMSMNIFLLA
tara:strand:+ start:410 stop:889 length:480 start_codon:yes stop_codon:yes gene_type:complete